MYFWYRHHDVAKHMVVRWAIQGTLIEHRRMSSTDRKVDQKLDDLGEKVTCPQWLRRYVVEDVA